MKNWPVDDTKTVYFDALIAPIKKALLFMYDVKRKNEDKDVPYSRFGGYNTEDGIQATTFSPEVSLTVDNLKFDKEDQSRDGIDAILAIAFQMGFCQGKRQLREKIVNQIRHMRLILKIFKKYEKVPFEIINSIEEQVDGLERSIRRLEFKSKLDKKKKKGV